MRRRLEPDIKSDIELSESSSDNDDEERADPPILDVLHPENMENIIRLSQGMDRLTLGATNHNLNALVTDHRRREFKLMFKAHLAALDAAQGRVPFFLARATSEFTAFLARHKMPVELLCQDTELFPALSDDEFNALERERGNYQKIRTGRLMVPFEPGMTFFGLCVIMKRHLSPRAMYDVMYGRLTWSIERLLLLLYLFSVPGEITRRYQGVSHLCYTLVDAFNDLFWHIECEAADIPSEFLGYCLGLILDNKFKPILVSFMRMYDLELIRFRRILPCIQSLASASLHIQPRMNNFKREFIEKMEHLPVTQDQPPYTPFREIVPPKVSATWEPQLAKLFLAWFKHADPAPAIQQLGALILEAASESDMQSTLFSLSWDQMFRVAQSLPIIIDQNSHHALHFITCFLRHPDMPGALRFVSPMTITSATDPTHRVFSYFRATSHWHFLLAQALDKLRTLDLIRTFLTGLTSPLFTQQLACVHPSMIAASIDTILKVYQRTTNGGNKPHHDLLLAECIRVLCWQMTGNLTLTEFRTLVFSPLTSGLSILDNDVPEVQSIIAPTLKAMFGYLEPKMPSPLIAVLLEIPFLEPAVAQSDKFDEYRQEYRVFVFTILDYLCETNRTPSLGTLLMLWRLVPIYLLSTEMTYDQWTKAKLITKIKSVQKAYERAVEDVGIGTHPLSLLRDVIAVLHVENERE